MTLHTLWKRNAIQRLLTAKPTHEPVLPLCVFTADGEQLKLIGENLMLTEEIAIAHYPYKFTSPTVATQEQKNEIYRQFILDELKELVEVDKDDTAMLDGFALLVGLKRRSVMDGLSGRVNGTEPDHVLYKRIVEVIDRFSAGKVVPHLRASLEHGIGMYVSPV